MDMIDGQSSWYGGLGLRSCSGVAAGMAEEVGE